MPDTENRRLSAPQYLAALSWRFPKAVLVAWVSICLAALYGISFLSVDTSTASFLDRSSPEWSVYQRSLMLHGGDEFLVVALEAPSPWHLGTLEDLRRLSSIYEDLPGVRRVDSLATVPLIRSVGDRLETDPALEDSLLGGDKSLEEYRHLVEADLLAANSLVSGDGRVFAINLLLSEDVDAPRSALVGAVRDSLDGLRARVTGVPVFRTAVNSQTQSELVVFAPITLFLLFLVLYISMQGRIAFLIPVLVGGVSALVAVGGMGALGVSLSLSTTILPSMLLALGCAYSMHVVAISGGASQIVDVAFPVALSGVTTTIGFLAMATVPIDAIRELATFGALGVATGSAAALSLCPALMSFLSVRVAPGDSSFRRVSRLAPSIQRFMSSHRRRVLGAWGLLVAVSLFGLVKLDIETDIIQWFPHGSSIRDDYEVVRSQLSGITPVNILLEPSSDLSPDAHSYRVVEAISALSFELEERKDVGKVLSIADPLRLTRAAFVGDRELPKDDAEIEQLLLMLSGMNRLDDVLHEDRRSASILLRMNDNSSDQLVGLGEWVQSWWKEHGFVGYRVSTTGIMYEFGRAEEAIAHGQISGLILATLSIGIVLALFLRSVTGTTIAMLVNLVPIGLVFGAMGLLSVPLDAATVCLGSMALGIAVDDTIHLISAYRASIQGGATADVAMRNALDKVMPPLTMTTLAIAIGFAVLAFSSFTLIGNLGIVTSITVCICLLADLTLLPALLLERAYWGVERPSAAPAATQPPD